MIKRFHTVDVIRTVYCYSCLHRARYDKEARLVRQECMSRGKKKLPSEVNRVLRAGLHDHTELC